MYQSRRSADSLNRLVMSSLAAGPVSALDASFDPRRRMAFPDDRHASSACAFAESTAFLDGRAPGTLARSGQAELGNSGTTFCATVAAAGPGARSAPVVRREPNSLRFQLQASGAFMERIARGGAPPRAELRTPRQTLCVVGSGGPWSPLFSGGIRVRRVGATLYIVARAGQVLLIG